MGLFSDNVPATRVLLTGKELACVVCGYNEFHERIALLNTPGMTFLDLEWANRSASCQVCARCRYIHWCLDRD